MTSLLGKSTLLGFYFPNRYLIVKESIRLGSLNSACRLNLALILAKFLSTT
ncbi:hypothetical protein DSUL_20453 [Desulfovibrionales bacterium]